jgi:sec-independent protein translocase protein TatA
MFGLQPLHLIIIVVAAIVIFVPSRLPEMVRSLGKTVREFRTAIREPVAGSEPPKPADDSSAKK